MVHALRGLGPLGVLVGAALIVMWAGATQGLELPRYKTSVQATFRNRTGFFLAGGENFANQTNVLDRFEQRLELDAKKRFSPDLTGTLKLRFFIDNVFEVQDDDDRWSGQPITQHNLGNTFDLAYDDFVREAYIDYTLGEMPPEYGKLFGRFGKQQVAWGKADGFRLLDIINPFDFREPLFPNFEEVRIPLWMIRLDYTLPRHILGEAGVQVIGIPFYQNDTFPPAIFSPWSFQAFDEFQAVANGLVIPGFQFRVLPNLFDEVEEPPATFENWEAGIRWSHNIRNFSYTLNYLYDWTNLPHVKPILVPVSPLDPLGFAYLSTPDRVHRIGASFDYNFYRLPLVQLENVVLRGEFLGSIDNVFYGAVQPDGRAHYQRDTFEYVLGLDKIVFGVPMIAPTANTSTFVSFQFFQTIISDPREDGLTNAGGAFLNDVKNSVSGFLQNTSLEQRLTSELLAAYTDAGEWWFRPRFIYDWSDAIKLELGGNFFIGHENDFLGGFASRGMQQVFWDIRYQIM